MKRLAFILLTLSCLTAPAWAANPDGIAVIIGNRLYEGRIPAVDFAHRDAEAIERYVVDVLGFSSDNVINLRDAGKAEMEAVFGNRETHKGRLWSYLAPDGGSDVVVFYSGHGVPGQRSGRGYLLPVDAAPDQAEINGYPLDLLYDNLGKLEARSKLVLIDACFSGDSPKGMLIEAASPVFIQPKAADAPAGVTVLTAASGAQLASWDNDAQHGLFTEFLLRALYGAADRDGDGAVTAAEVKSFLDGTMTRVARRRFMRDQTATLLGDETLLLTRLGPGGPLSRPKLEPAAPPKPAARPDAREFSPGSTFKDCPRCPEMVVVPAGSFMMGSPPTEPERTDTESPRHRVDIAAPFAIGKYEVTIAEYDRCVQAGGCATAVDDNGFGRGVRPAINVDWTMARDYAVWLSRETDQPYRLPSEAEWEYAARAGTDTPFNTGATIRAAQANFDSEFGPYVGAPEEPRLSKTAMVGSYPANGFGLHDMHGNAREWVADCWHDNYAGAPTDGTAWIDDPTCEFHPYRGGGWGTQARFVRSAFRSAYPEYLSDPSTGFRVARDLPR